jgi:hypothetical protein
MKKLTFFIIALMVFSCKPTNEDAGAAVTAGPAVKAIESVGLYDSKGLWLTSKVIALDIGLPLPGDSNKYTLKKIYNLSTPSEQRMLIHFTDLKGVVLPDNHGNTIQYEIPISSIEKLGSAKDYDQTKEVKVKLYHDNDATESQMRQYANELFAATNCEGVIHQEGMNLKTPRKCGKGVISP